jgi:hypothetical protein
MRAKAISLSASSGSPVLAVDPARVPQWADLAHAPDVATAIKWVWGEGKHTAYTARDPEDVDKLSAAAREGKDVVFVVDEYRPYGSAHSAPMGLLVLCREHRHSRADVLLGSQKITDMSSEILSAADVVHHGRVGAPRILEYLRTEYGLDVAKVAALGRGEWIETKMGF